MRIAITTDQYLPLLSGLVDSVIALSAGLRLRGHAVRLYAPGHPDNAVDTNVFSFPSFRMPGSRRDIFINMPLGGMRDIRAFKPDIIHTHLFGIAGYFAWYAARRLHLPLVGTDHTFPADYLGALDFPPFPYVVREHAAFFYNRCDYVTTPSQSMLDELILYGMRRPSRIISNAIPDIFRPLREKAVLKKKYKIPGSSILMFGRIAPDKNLGIAVDVFETLTKSSDATLVFLGDGISRREIEERLHAKHLSDRALFLGTLRGESLVEAINACDVHLITNKSENQPMTMLQSAACALPIVGPRSGGLPEYVREGETGYLVDVDNIAQFTDRLLRILKDERLARSLGEAAQRNIQQFSVQSIAREFESVYSSLL